MGTAVASERWYVIRTKPKQESRAEANLHSGGLETFAPRVRELRITTRYDARFIVASLFPGYLFARFDASTWLAKVRMTRGVHSIVGFGEPATPVDDAAVHLIRNQVSDDGLIRIDDAPRVGDTVEVIGGPLRSLVGIFETGLSGGERARILLLSVMCQARVDVPSAFIRKTAAI